MTTPAQTNLIWRFGVFEVDTHREELRRSGTPVKLREQSFRILVHLLEHAGDIVTREQLRTVLWPSDTFVDFDHSLNTAIMKLREALGDSTGAPLYIETLPKKGYRFVAPITVAEPDHEPAAVEDRSHLADSRFDPRSGLEPAATDPLNPNSARPLEHWPAPTQPQPGGILSLASPPSSQPRARALLTMGRPLLWAAVLHVVFATIYLGWTWRHLHRASTKVWISDIAPPDRSEFVSNPEEGSPPVLSPDGRRLVFVAQRAGGTQMLWLRELNGGGDQPVPGTAGAMLPFWSPDGRFIGFFAGGKIRDVNLTSGSTRILADAPYGRGATWNSNNTIVFAPTVSGPLYQLSVAKGSESRLTALNPDRGEYSQRWPQFLPGGRSFIYFTASSSPENEGTYVSSLDTHQSRLLLPGVSNSLYASGYLLYIVDGTLFARPFDLVRLRFRGDARPLKTGIADAQSDWKGIFSASDNGVLAYYSGDVARNLPLNLVDRSGQIVDTLPEPGETPAVSDDGRSIALAGRGGLNGDLWVYDIGRRFISRVTSSPEQVAATPSSSTRRVHLQQAVPATGRKAYPVWSPDEKTILFSWNRSPEFGIYATAADGTGPIQTLLATPGLDQVAASWSRDGRFIAFERSDPVRTSVGSSIWILPLAGRVPYAIVTGDFNASRPQISPDGRWLAYVSDESGKSEIYLTSFPRGTGKWRLSTSGGDCPRWRGDSHELFFVTADNRLASVSFGGTVSAPEVGDPHPLFEVHPPLGAGDAFYDVLPDGQHFVIASSQSQTGTHFTLVVNWPALLDGK